jgi:hypothetical protein
MTPPNIRRLRGFVVVAHGEKMFTAGLEIGTTCENSYTGRNAMLVLSIDEHGKAELLEDGETLWASDSDPDVVDEFGTDVFEDDDGEALADYLEEIGMLTREQKSELEIESPVGPGDEEEDDDDSEE